MTRSKAASKAAPLLTTSDSEGTMISKTVSDDTTDVKKPHTVNAFKTHLPLGTKFCHIVNGAIVSGELMRAAQVRGEKGFPYIVKYDDGSRRVVTEKVIKEYLAGEDSLQERLAEAAEEKSKAENKSLLATSADVKCKERRVCNVDFKLNKSIK